MTSKEIYYRIKRMIILILIALVLITFVGMINMYAQLQDMQGAVDILIEYIGR